MDDFQAPCTVALFLVLLAPVPPLRRFLVPSSLVSSTIDVQQKVQLGLPPPTLSWYGKITYQSRNLRWYCMLDPFDILDINYVQNDPALIICQTRCSTAPTSISSTTRLP
ncbi:hypothetical protein E1B28_010763 [Marasmius oreades]|uniref:Uncharacterized protein n=1 Tax=Marasmius oreades TaxID=181124 RepID=A0A9P7RU26_9AGAR|nr:uncharacterized protein E1B28_010763 [Marasmius oreades]KAG7089053.1 hypothetical protein E1B28_010763 [Marasmius oreades]